MTAELVKKWLILGLFSGNLVIWTVFVLGKVLFSCFWVPREINLRSCSKTQWQMFLLVSGRHVGWAPTWRLHTNLYIFGWHTSANSARIKNSGDLILGEVVYITIIYYIPDSWIYLLNGYDFFIQFWSHDWWKPRIVSLLQYDHPTLTWRIRNKAGQACNTACISCIDMFPSSPMSHRT